MKRIAFTASLILASTFGPVKATEFQQRTEAGVGLFDQGGELYNREASSQASRARSYGYPAKLSLDSTASPEASICSSAVPADNERNEQGQGMILNQPEAC
jgi:hypothetical protein